MRCYIVTSIPHDTDILPYTVGVFSSYEAAEEAQKIEAYCAPECLIDINEHVMNKIEANKVALYEERERN